MCMAKVISCAVQKKGHNVLNIFQNTIPKDISTELVPLKMKIKLIYYP